MIFTQTLIPGAYVIAPEAKTDARGSFARTWCAFEFENMGLNRRLVQCSTSFNAKSDTLRGLHYQAAPHLEAKLVRCTRGAAFDVIVDMRRDSPAFGRWFGTEITAGNGTMIYVPEGVAHGFQTLVDETEIFYQISTYYAPEFATGIRWNDPDIGVRWPMPRNPVISDKDAALPYLCDITGAPRRAIAV